MDRTSILLVITLFYSSILLGQSQMESCNKIKKGTFYFYSSHTPNKYIIIRSDSLQEEINLTKKDTTYWKIIKESNCIFYQKFLKQTQPLTESDKRFDSHVTIIKVTNITKDYYLFSAELDSDYITNKHRFEDTIWFKPRIIKKSN